GEPVDLNDIRPGDLLFFTLRPDTNRVVHVGIALPNHRMIHASRFHKSIVISDWSAPYYKDRLFAARRLRA
ncbi:MAG TPA: NlpC/P60 family protein, partial [Myxococcota bacterium]|nr:NlpC/P60 family protein [Myxococcota bacterium]